MPSATYCIISANFCRCCKISVAYALLLALLIFPTQAREANSSAPIESMRLADGRTSNLKAQLEAAYTLLSIKDRRAVLYLKRAAALAPQDARVHEQLGYALLAEQDLDGAVAAFRIALAHDPRNQKLRMQIVYTEDALGKRRAAAREALIVAQGGGERAAQGCRAYHNVAGLPDRPFPDGWFGEFYAAPEYRTTGHVGVAPVQLRLGHSLIGEDVLSLYTSIRATRDNRSGGSGVGSQVYFDNHLVVAGGLRLRPWEGAPVYAFV